MTNYLETADELRRLERFDHALELVQRHLAEDPDSARAHVIRAQCLLRLNREDESREAIQSALSIAPEYAFAHYVNSFVERNDAEKSLAAAQQALRLEPVEAAYWARVAELHLEQSHFELARHMARKGLEQNPMHRDCGLWEAYAILSLDHSNAAMRYVERVLSRHPDDDRVHTVRGWIHLERGELHEAHAAFREALRIDPGERWAECGLEEVQRFFPRPFPGIRAALRGWLSWRGLGQTAALAAAYGGGSLFTTDLGLPWWLLILLGLCEVVLATGVLLYWLAEPLIRLLGANAQGGFRRHTRQRLKDLQVLGWFAMMALLAWGLYVATGAPYLFSSATNLSWSMVAISATFYSLPGWRHRVTFALTCSFVAFGHLAPSPWWPQPVDGQVLSIPGLLDGLATACLLLAIQFPGECLAGASLESSGCREDVR